MSRKKSFFSLESKIRFGKVKNLVKLIIQVVNLDNFPSNDHIIMFLMH